MKNKISTTFFLTFLVVIGLGLLHYLPTMKMNGDPLRKVDLLADIRPDKPEPVLAVVSADSDTLVLPPPVKPVFIDSCKPGIECIEDYADSTAFGMSAFYEALEKLKTSDRPVRIAYFGDSFIEGDILTADLRASLQEKFGGCGVGYMPLTSITAGFRPTVRHQFDHWETHTVTDSIGFIKRNQGISNHYFLADSMATISLKGQRKYASCLDTCEVSDFYFLTPDSIRLTAQVNNKEIEEFILQGDSTLQKVSVEGRIGKVTWTVNESTPASLFYGATMDPLSGIVLDNFSTRGSSGQQLGGIPLSILKQYNELRTYDLIVLHYGLNVAFEEGVNYNYYKEGMKPVVAKLKKAFPQASILIVGIGDRESKDENGDLRTIPGVKNLIRYQQALAAETHVAFWNLYQAMGGEGSIVEMVDAEPPMANLDYTHINFRGGKHIAHFLFEALMHGKEQYEKRKAYEM